jgi:5,10-methylene-tetrahydrofolate dehydrogenase/methenyl tetrahydrofolate cyclohydrolase
MFYGLIYIFQALFKMHVDITNQKAAVVGNVSYNGKVMEQQILQDYNTVSYT